jgi:hypothetical protein
MFSRRSFLSSIVAAGMPVVSGIVAHELRMGRLQAAFQRQVEGAAEIGLHDPLLFYVWHDTNGQCHICSLTKRVLRGSNFDVDTSDSDWDSNCCIPALKFV